MNVTVLSGSRADYGLLECPIAALKADPFFKVEVRKIWGATLEAAASQSFEGTDLLMVLGDRYEILGACTRAHLDRVPIAHLCGGDVTEGSYDDAMRDAISRMASIHFVTSTSAMARLTHMGYRNVHLVGNPALDYIRNMPWKVDSTTISRAGPYVVVSYQAETIDGTNDIRSVIKQIPDGVYAVFLLPNIDRGSDDIDVAIRGYVALHPDRSCYYEYLPHAEFLNLIYHCDEFIGNSSSMLYEAPELGVKVRMIGKRQRGRVIPMGDGNASKRIVKILKYIGGTL